MNQEKIGKIIKKIRKDNRLTQQDLANKLGVTYQAVSKWENGKSIPDISILKQISDKFNIDLTELLDGKEKNKKSTTIYIVLITIFFILVLTLIIIIFTNKESYEFKSLTTTNKDFKVNGVVAYSSDKNSLYISDIDYNGTEKENEYKVVECTLYEKNGKTETKISQCGDIKKYKNTTTTESLSNLLKNIKFNIGDYSHSCKNLTANDLYLQINALDEDNKTVVYKIPLKLNDECINN